MKMYAVSVCVTLVMRDALWDASWDAGCILKTVATRTQLPVRHTAVDWRCSIGHEWYNYMYYKKVDMQGTSNVHNDGVG
jgi:hypothetical protein